MLGRIGVFAIRGLFRELRGIRKAIEQHNRIAALQLQHDTGASAMFLLEEPLKPPAESRDVISTPDYAYISNWHATATILREQLGREPSDDEIEEVVEGHRFEPAVS